MKSVPIDYIVLPLKQKLEARGETFYINLNFVNFRTSSGSDITLSEHPDEYAEFMLVVFQHMDNKYGFVPDAIEVILEPNLADPGWRSNTAIGDSIVATAQKLEAFGYSPDFIAPSTSVMTNAKNYFDSMVAYVPASLTYLTELSYHCYVGRCSSDDALLGEMASRGNQYNIGTSMLEWWNSNNTYEVLHKGLKIANNSAWQQGALAGRPATDMYRIDETDPSNPTVYLGDYGKFSRQYFKFVRKGAVRIKADTSNSSFDPLVFINTDGIYVVVVKATTGGDFSIQDLPAGIYGIKYTTGDGRNPPLEYDIDLLDETINIGQILTTNIPDQGVITIYGKSVSAPSPTPTSTFTPTPSPIPGDADGDGDVDITDYSIWLTQYLNYNPTTDADPDFDENDTVDGVDYVIWLNNYNGAYFNVSVTDESFCLYLTDPKQIQLATDVYHGRAQAVPQGPVLAGSGGFNYGFGGQPDNKYWRWWSWHLDPAQTQMVEAAIEVCDGLPSAVESWSHDGSRTYCPWWAQITALSCLSPSNFYYPYLDYSLICNHYPITPNTRINRKPSIKNCLL